ncbi:glucosaminidase domain-containing protein [Peptococcus simiae]|uniref:glucosaminidase domain-containing protein n=1 Tax=Peptococcus simiae TaxID=1643805 RepID=UPI00397FE4A6
MDQTSFIAGIAPGAVQGWEQEGILPSLSIAQAILESGWGTSVLAVQANNLFGIKASDDWQGKTLTVPTKEWVNGRYITIHATFRAYDSWADSVADHARFFTSTDWRKNLYAAVIGESGYIKACRAIQVAGYATAPDYATKLINLIEQYDLTRYDKQGSETMTKGVGKGSNYQYITQYDSPNHWGQRSKTEAIVIHWWDDPAKKPSFDGVVSWLCDVRSRASAHYVVEAGKVACIVDPHLMAWHVAEPTYVNQTTIGVECNPRAWDSDHETVAELVADLWHEWGKLPVKRHRDYMSTQCPGNYDLDRLIARAEEIYAGQGKTRKDEVELRPEVAEWITSLYDQAHKDTPADWGKDAWQEATEKDIVDGQRPNAMMTRLEYAASELRRLEK